MTTVNLSQKQIKVHVGSAPLFDPEMDERPQILEWMEWSAKTQLLNALLADQDAINAGHDPDEGR